MLAELALHLDSPAVVILNRSSALPCFLPVNSLYFIQRTLSANQFLEYLRKAVKIVLSCPVTNNNEPKQT